ncbi:hypothetical protein [Micromonospora sp. NPDC005173]|uniref:hypothetical protein n=1 Tax=Micromonospora sp. NPDC005173 TaxID=3157165 RepID=UPI0033A29F48
MATQHLSDAELAAQPAAYWTGVAYEALIAFTRARQAEFGFTQPQFWLLRNLSKNDISPDGHGMTITELKLAMSSYLRPEDDLEAEAEVLLSGLGSPVMTRDGCGSPRTATRLVPTSRSTLRRSVIASTRASRTPTT